MCGIMAYVGSREVRPLLLEGLRRLEYRGYDSAGMATLAAGRLEVLKKAGRIEELCQEVAKEERPPAHQGISHTRWATHGEPSDANAHPHVDRSGGLVVVHNGVIEHFQPLKRRLEAEGHVFASATDTEVLAHLIGAAYEKAAPGAARLGAALRSALAEVEGSYGVAVMHRDHPGLIVGARRGSPLVLGLGEGEMFLCSDALALLPYTRRVVYLRDCDLVEVRAEGFRLGSLGEGGTDYAVEELEMGPEAAERGEYAHFMLKEIYEQPQALEQAWRGRINEEEASAPLGGLKMSLAEWQEIERVMVLGCGTARHAGMVGAYMLENVAQVAAETDCASEFRFRERPLARRSLFIAISQSGETADTLGALREVRRRGFRCLGFCNGVGSSLARESDGGMYLRAGPEIGVAATKSFVSQVALFGLLALGMGRRRQLSASRGREIIEAYARLPGQMRRILAGEDAIAALAQKYAQVQRMLFLGRQHHYPIALEAALKLKEISYIHAAGFPAGELKHGIIALIDPETPSLVICPRDSLYEKNLSTIQEIRARKGPVIALATEGDEDIRQHADDVIFVPRTIDMWQPILSVLPLQLFAYHAALALGRDVDKPRNLAKSVTVD